MGSRSTALDPVANTDTKLLILWSVSKVTKKGNAAIKKWIAEQQHGRSCTVVLVGSNTAGRKWINHEIITSWDDGMGVVGIHIHGLKNLNGETATKGSDPFDNITHGVSGKKLSSIRRYRPSCL